MERFKIWTGGNLVNASCTDCDFRMSWDGITDATVIVEAMNSHDCFEDEDRRKR